MATFSIDLLTGKPYLFTGDFTNSGMTTFSGVTSVVNGLSMVTSRQARLGGVLNCSTILTRGAGNTAGVEYGGDYSASFSNRSLVDKGYVDLKVSGSTPNWLTLTNRPAWLTGTTLSAFQLAHSHSQYLTNANFNSFTGTTLPGNYYNKAQINSYTGSTATAINAKLNKSTFSTYTGTTAPGQFASKSFLSTYTGTTAPNTFANKAVFNTYTGSTAPGTYQTIANVSHYTGVTAPGTYQTITNVSHYTGSTAPNTYYNKTQINSYTASTNTKFNNYTGATNTRINGKQDTLVAGLGITIIGNVISSTGGGSGSTSTTLQLLDITGGINVNTIAATPVTWTQQVFSGTSLSFTGGSRIYVKATGIYDISYALNVANGSNSIKNIGSVVRKNGNTDITPLSSSSLSTDLTNNASTNSLPQYLISLLIGDYFELMGFRIGSSGTTSTKANGSWITIKRIS